MDGEDRNSVDKKVFPLWMMPGGSMGGMLGGVVFLALLFWVGVGTSADSPGDDLRVRAAPDGPAEPQPLQVQNANMLANGSFESGTADDFERSYDNSWVFFKIAGDPAGTMDRVETQAGARAYRFELGTAGRAYLHSRPFEVEPDQTYDISGWVKAENAAEESVFIRIFWFKDRIGVAASRKFDDTDKLGGSFQWEQVDQTVRAPADATTAYIRLEPNSGNLEFGGDRLFYESAQPVSVWFDNIGVTAAD